MASQEPFEKHEKLLRFIAHKVWRRTQAAGAASIQLEDIFGELCVAWCLARDGWDQTQGVPFGAYLMRGMSHHINRWVKYELRQHEMAPIELDAEFSTADRDSAGTLHDHVADHSQPVPEDTLIVKDMREYARDPNRWRKGGEKLMPETEKFLDLMDSPPPSIVAMVKGIQTRAVYGREQLGIPSTFAPSKMTGGLIFDLMGTDARTRKAVQKQIKRLHEEVGRQ